MLFYIEEIPSSRSSCGVFLSRSALYADDASKVYPLGVYAFLYEWNTEQPLLLRGIFLTWCFIYRSKCPSRYKTKKEHINVFFFHFVARGGFEPSTPWVWTMCSSQLSYLAMCYFIDLRPCLATDYVSIQNRVIIVKRIFKNLLVIWRGQIFKVTATPMLR